MCGIIGYAGHRPAVPVVVEGLRRLEYRGYDSAGVAFLRQGALDVVRATGKLAALEEKLAHEEGVTTPTCAMGHTRWATHGVPAERNAHPHRSNDGALAMVHNGIIENYLEIKADLTTKGYTFSSETDTEVLVNLIAERRKTEPDLLHAFAAALREAHGAYAVCLMCSRRARKRHLRRAHVRPAHLRPGHGRALCGLGHPGLSALHPAGGLSGGRRAGARHRHADYAVLRTGGPALRCSTRCRPSSGTCRPRRKGGYRHFMLKEIFEQPRVITDGLAGRDRRGPTTAALLPGGAGCALPVPRRLHIVACGTSYHSGLWAPPLCWNTWAGVPVQVEIASEFRYRDSLLLDKDDMVLVISQSGETADTLAALRIARERRRGHGAGPLQRGGLVHRARGFGRALHPGRAGNQRGLHQGHVQPDAHCWPSWPCTGAGGRTCPAAGARPRAELIAPAGKSLPALLDDALPAMHATARELARKYAQARNFFYLGRGHCYPLALEGALKLKELSYIHAEGYAAGEMKHGPIALIDPAFPTFALALDDGLLPKVVSNMVEVQARQGKVIALTNPGVEPEAEDVWRIPALPAPLAGFMALPALQLFSYEMADYLGKDVDQPRNLAKSVTVE